MNIDFSKSPDGLVPAIIQDNTLIKPKKKSASPSLVAQKSACGPKVRNQAIS
jgi:hypothetical protein